MKYLLLLLTSDTVLIAMSAPAHGPAQPAPYCYICSANLYEVFHHHHSGREIRIVQGVDKTETLPYMCTTCKTVHPDRPDEGLNVLVGTGQLHDLHNPRDRNKVPIVPDPLHIDWLTVVGATIRELEFAWLRDYASQTKPMRILLSAGIDDLDRGKTRDEIVESFMHFKLTVDRQNACHPDQPNELVIATILNPPKYVWFTDNGPEPRNHSNLLKDIMEINSWIVFYNKQNGKSITPRFHRFGIRDGWSKDKDGKKTRVKKHIMDQWDPTKPVKERIYLCDQVTHKVARAVTRHFKGELERYGKLG